MKRTHNNTQRNDSVGSVKSHPGKVKDLMIKLMTMWQYMKSDLN